MDYYAAFTLGLIGSLHCAGMCGPLALALPRTGDRAVSFVTARAAYNFGRIVTYCGLGVVFGVVGKSLSLAGFQRWLSIALGITLLAGLFASRKLGLSRPVTILVGKLKSVMAIVLGQRSMRSMALLGLLNGLLPCGLVYAACVGAASMGTVLAGAAYMAIFGLGTIPLMLTISLSGKLLPTKLRLKLGKAIPASVVLLATLLILRGLSLGIPYLSPNLGNAGFCCH
jgi:uncharacterized protein